MVSVHQGSHLKCLLLFGGYLFWEFPVCVLHRSSARVFVSATGLWTGWTYLFVRSVSNLIFTLLLLITIIFGYICQYIRLLTYLDMYFVIFVRGFWYFWTYYFFFFFLYDLFPCVYLDEFYCCTRPIWYHFCGTELYARFTLKH